MTAIINAELVLHDRYLPNAALLIEDGKIADFGEMKNIKIPEGCEIIDAKGEYLAPGFIDIHTHSGGDSRFETDMSRSAINNLKQGTTTVFNAIYYKHNKETILKFIKEMKEIMLTEKAPNLWGVYMEGPYLNPKFGSNRSNNPWAGPIKAEDYNEIIDALGDIVYVWCVAPEREGIEEFCKAAKAKKPSVKFAVAHSEAAPEDIEKLVPYGLCIGTHHTNATGDRPRYSETRGVCVDEFVRYNSDVYAEIISDSLGIHVHPYMQRLTRKIKGDEKIILISDAEIPDGPIPPEFEGVTDIAFDKVGEISGAMLTVSVAARNFMVHTGASLVDVFNYASYNPAKAVGLTDRGEIAVGKRADLVIVDGRVNVKEVILGGKIYDRKI